jgi:HAD superfamily hydrolase (TIGR01509 family)
LVVKEVSILRGVIFDMDGVLVDTEAWICRAATAMFAEHGLAVRPADFLPFVGAGENRYIGGVAEKYGLALDLERDKARTYELYAELVRGKLRPLPGAREFIAGCRAHGLRLALATSADRVKMEVNLREIGLPVASFDAAVNGLDVEKKKPDPQIFLLAARRLGLPPGQCLVVEDAVNGVAAAKAAGCRCLALTTSFSREQLAAADWFAPTLAEAPEEALDW